MINIFLGAPGTGKGTVSHILKSDCGYNHISTGDLFRAITKQSTPLAKEIKDLLAKGELINDNLTFKVLKENLKNYNLQKDEIILDGYPRNIAQADLLFEYFKDFKNIKIQAINFVVDENLLIERLQNRLVCPKCGKSYHKKEPFLKPKKEWFCDLDNQKLIQREDDKLASIKHRLSIYNKDTKPLIKYFENKKILISIDASHNSKVVFEKVFKECNQH